MSAAAPTYMNNPKPVAPAAANQAYSNAAYDQYGQPRYSTQQASAQQGYVHEQPYAPQQPYAQTAGYYTAQQPVYSSGDACQYPAALPSYATHRYVRTVRVRTAVAPAPGPAGGRERPGARLLHRRWRGPASRARRWWGSSRARRRACRSCLRPRRPPRRRPRARDGRAPRL